VDYDLCDSPAPGSVGGDSKSARGTFKIDDFVYERGQVDQIFKAIEGSLLKGHPPKPKTQPPPPKVPPRPKL
jgi:hypothetical protein